MRSLFLCAVALVALCSAAKAERITIVGVVANYVTARDAVDFEVWLDRPLDMRADWLSLTGGHPYVVDGTFDGPMFGVRNGAANAPVERFDLASWRQVGGSQADRVVRGEVQFNHIEADRNGVMRHVMLTTLNADDLLFDQITAGNGGRFAFKAVVRFVNENGVVQQDYVNGMSSVNAPRLIHAPEPSALMLFAMAHLVWLPSARQRFRKWRSVREPNRVGRHAEVA